MKEVEKEFEIEPEYGFIYVVQEEVHNGTSIYKVGMTIQSKRSIKIKRLDAYGKNSMLYLVREVPISVIEEQRITKIKAKELYSIYVSWMNTNETISLTLCLSAWGKKLSKLFIKKYKSNGMIYILPSTVTELNQLVKK